MMKNAMSKLFILCLTAVFPVLVFAQDSGGSLSFAPPPGDYSMQFLGNIFGQVDGTLYGSGSLLLGTIFGVFNSAVMALGGIIIMYTLMVSTMNTAQEGQLLGQKWSSIWIPIRSTVGLALLVPKASGYCMMQIFVMWVVVQGVGAADKIWNAALNYLMSGGSIVQANMDPTKSLFAGGGDISAGATNMLAGQVCMGALQKLLQQQREAYMESKQKGAGPCAGNPSGDMKQFCDTPVPDFVNSFNAVATQNVPLTDLLTQDSFTVKMPNIKSGPYHSLEGICGTIQWNNFILSSLKGLSSEVTESNSWEDIAESLSKVGLSIGIGNLQTVAMSRAIAVQQMYQTLSPVARRIVDNMPGLQGGDSANNTTPVSSVAIQPYGVPLTSGGQECTASTTNCVSWGMPFGSGSAPLLNGTEFQGAISNYNAIMRPALTLIAQAGQAQADQDAKKFINDAKTQGWIMAGSYFFDLVRLNQNAQIGQDETDKDSGLSSSTFEPSDMIKPFADNNKCTAPHEALCTWLAGDQSQVQQIIAVINGSGIVNPVLDKPSLNKEVGGIPTSSSPTPVTSVAASTVYGFIQNSETIVLPGQPGKTGPQFGMKFNLDINASKYYLPKQDFGRFGCILGVCLGSAIVGGMYNYVIRVVMNGFLAFFGQIINVVIQALLILPLLGIASIFQKGVSYITQTNADPIVALANMGVYYINFANELWIFLIGITLMTALIPIFGQAIYALFALVLPFLMAWLAIMLSVGFITAYYVPFLPYMIFTFGSIAWLMAVIEAMVAAPIVALGVTHPEGNEAFGKGEQAIMLILNVFLRPSMMVIGFFCAIILSYVAVWLLNAGFHNVATYISGDGTTSVSVTADFDTGGFDGTGEAAQKKLEENASRISDQGYSGWAGIYAFFFSLLMYTTLYIIVVQKSFTLITLLPDKVLRWIGGQPESIGAETAQWGEEAKQKVEKAGGDTSKASQQMDQQLTAKTMGGINKIKQGMGGGQSGVNVAQGSTPSKDEE